MEFPRPTLRYRTDLNVESDLLCNGLDFQLKFKSKMSSNQLATVSDNASCIKAKRINIPQAIRKHHPNSQSTFTVSLSTDSSAKLCQSLLCITQNRANSEMCNKIQKPEMKQNSEKCFSCLARRRKGARGGRKQIEKLQRAVFNCNLWALWQVKRKGSNNEAQRTMKLKTKRKRKPQ